MVGGWEVGNERWAVEIDGEVEVAFSSRGEGGNALDGMDTVFNLSVVG